MAILASLLPNGKQTFLDANGKPLASGSVAFYVPNTTTPKTTWQDPGEVTPNANPVPLDSAGTAIIYGSGQYRQIVKDVNGNTIWDQLTDDPISAIQTGNNTFSGNNTFTGANDFTGGSITAPTQAVGDNSANVATDEFVANALATIGSTTFQNKIRNGNFNIFQRGTSGTVTAGTTVYTADGFYVGPTGANATWSSNGAGINGSTNALAINSTIGLTDLFIKQRIEGSIAAALNTTGLATFQCTIFNNTSTSITPKLSMNTANSVDGWGSSSTFLASTSLSPCAPGMWTVVNFTVNSNNSMNNGIEAIIDFGNSLNGSGPGIAITNWDFRPSGLSTGITAQGIPAPELRPYPFELLYCQRYFIQISASTNKFIGYGYSPANLSFEFQVPIPIQMRIIPTITPPLVANIQINGGSAVGSTLIVSSINFPTQIALTFSGTVVSGLTAGNAMAVRWAGNSGAISASAEL